MHTQKKQIKSRFNTRAAFFKIIITLLIGIPALTFSQASDSKSNDASDTYRNLERFANVLSMIEKNYVEEIKIEEAIDGAIKGMLSALDPHSSLLKPDDFKELQVETKGSFSGIGIEITLKDNILTVVSPIEGTPAFKQGLKAGDKIIKIKDESTKDMSLMDAVKRLRGLKGTPVTVSIHRQGWTDLKEFTIIRDVIPLHSVKTKILEPGYVYLRITTFQGKTAQEAKEAMEKLVATEKDIKGLVLDVRNNPGGLLEQSVKVSDLFLDKGMIVSIKGRRHGDNMEFKAHDDGDKYSFPIVVLVNEGSASASEIVAGALQDHKRAIIIGTQTFGKGSVQTVIPMRDGSGLRLTTARYYTPNGISIQAKGITPDVIVPRIVQNGNGNGEEEKKKKSVLREKDLKHHILSEEEENGTTNKDKSKEKKEEQRKNKEKKSKEKEDTLRKIKEELQNDNQLRTALFMLKGLNVLTPRSR